MAQQKPTAAQRLTRARVLLLLDHPFFGTLATRLPNVMDESIRTACTDGTCIRWNPSFLAKLSDPEVMGVVAHEVMHVANGHTWRRGSRGMEPWNVAADKAINHIILNADLKLPKDCLLPDTNEAGKSAEQIYRDQQSGGKSQGGQGQGNGASGAQGSAGQPQSGQTGAPTPSNAATAQPAGASKATTQDPGGCGGVVDAPAGDQGAKQQEAEWRVAVAQAAAAAASQGKLPGDLRRLVDEIVNPKVPWTVVLRDFIERTARNDYNWSQPNRRYLGGGFYLPSLISEELPEIVLAVDTSGSIGKDQLAQFSAEISAILGTYETTIQVVYCDARVAGTQTFTRADLPLKLDHRGGGGTDFRPVFQWINKRGLTPACIIYLTDGYGTFPTSAPDAPVLWVMTTDHKAPFGEVVKL